MKKRMTDIQKLCNAICNDHYHLSKEDKNIHYLWYMYTEGHRQNDYSPFIYYVELNLCEYLNIITADENNNMKVMMESSDADNMYLVTQALIHFVKQRHDKYGVVSTSGKYQDVIDNYITKVFNKKLFIKR